MKQRIISAVIALLITVPLILLGGTYFELLALVLGILGLKELLRARKRIPNYMKYISYLLFAILFINNFDLFNVSYYIEIKILVLSILVILLPLIIYHDNKIYNIDDAFYILGSTLFLAIAFKTFVVIRNEGLMLTVYLLLIPIITDTCAYIFGNMFGKNKLVPSISPNKSVEGLLFGTLFGTIIPVIFYILVIGNIDFYYLIFITIFLSLIGQFGDLVFSSIKRHYDIKDYSNIMPGHGGILDRLDSIIFVILSYIFIVEFL